MLKNRVHFLLYLGLIAVTGLALVLWLTPFGSGVSPDSTIYIAGAESLLSGKGYSIDDIPITHFPPLYPFFLAAVGLLNGNLVQAARILNAVLFGVNLGLIALAVYGTAGRNYFTTTLAVLLFACSAPILILHSTAWSEPLFIAFTLACMILLTLYVVRPTLSLLIASALFMGFALLTRYIGAAFFPAALLIVFFGGQDRRVGSRIRASLVWAVLASIPLGLWSFRNLLLAGSAVNRSLVFHPMAVTRYITGIVSTILNYLAPGHLPAGVRPAIFSLLAVILIALFVIFFKRHLQEINWRSLGVGFTACCLLFFFSYLLFLYLSISFIDASTPINTRLLSPSLTIMIVGLFPAFWVISQTLRKPVVWWGFLLLIGLSLSMKTPEAVRTAEDIQKNGLEYTSRQWQSSPTMAFVKRLPEDVQIYSNGSDAVGFLTGKQTLSIPRKIIPTTNQANPHYNQEIDLMCKDVLENRAVVVYFDLVDWRGYLPPQAEVESNCQLPLVKSFEDGTVLGKGVR